MEGTVTNTYNEKGLETGITYPDGRRVQYAYDVMDRLIQVTGLDGSVTSYEYDTVGRRIQTTTGSRAATYANDPVNYADPSGEFKVPQVAAGGVAVAAGIGQLVYTYVTNPKKLKQDLANVKTAVTNLPKTVASVKDAFVSGAKTVANVYSANAINYAANRDKIVEQTIIDLFHLGGKMNADCPGKSLNERLQYACNLSNDLYESARFFQGLMNGPYETPYVWLNDPKTVKKGYDYLWKRLDAVGGVSLWDLSPAEMMLLQKMVAEEPTGMFDRETYDKIINTLVGYAEGSPRKDTLSERGYILTTTDLEVLHDRREEIDSKSSKEKVEETLKNIGKTVVYLVSAGVFVNIERVQ